MVFVEVIVANHESIDPAKGNYIRNSQRLPMENRTVTIFEDVIDRMGSAIAHPRVRSYVVFMRIVAVTVSMHLSATDRP